MPDKDPDIALCEAHHAITELMASHKAIARKLWIYESGWKAIIATGEYAPPTQEDVAWLVAIADNVCEACGEGAEPRGPKEARTTEALGTYAGIGIGDDNLTTGVKVKLFHPSCMEKMRQEQEDREHEARLASEDPTELFVAMDKATG